MATLASVEYLEYIFFALPIGHAIESWLRKIFPILFGKVEKENVKFPKIPDKNFLYKFMKHMYSAGL